MKKRSRALYYLFILTYSFLSGCKQDEVIQPISLNLNYVSNDVGKWIVYEADSIIHLDNDNNTDNNVDTAHFEIKEQLDSMGVDAENQMVQHLARYKRLNDALPWTFMSRWTAKITATGYQKVEENTRYLKLAFPINTSQKWNGNAFNNLGEEDYFYGALNQAAAFGSFGFDSTLTVIQGDATIGYHDYPYGIEKYATGLGMYYHYYAAVDFYPGTNWIVTGVEYYERMKSHGHY